MKYIEFGQDGKLRTRYDSDIHTPEQIPAAAIEVSDDLFAQTLNTMDGYWELVNGVATHTVPPPNPALMISAAQSRINTAYQSAVNALTAGYPEDEISSWPKQEGEARAWIADNSTATPWIDAAATSRGIAKTDFVALIIGNADALAPLHGALTGKRQKLRDQIAALGNTPTQEQLDAVQW